MHIMGRHGHYTHHWIKVVESDQLQTLEPRMWEKKVSPKILKEESGIC